MFNGDLTSEMVLKNGQIVDVPINFKNQIEAAKVLVNILGIQAQMQKDPEEKAEMKQMADELKELTKTFLSQRQDQKKSIADKKNSEDADVNED
jgi:TRAP-type mannitol/chloroaromatic compound transport system substrate-binding protein